MNLDLQYIEQILPTNSKQDRIEQISHVLMEIASGNFHEFAHISDDFDEIDAIASGVNMLSEELRDTVISRNYLDSVLRSIVDILFILDENFVIQQITPKVTNFFKKKEEELIGYSINTLFDGRKKGFVQRLKNSLRENGQLHNVSTTFKSELKENMPVSISLFTLKDNQNTATGYLMIGEDLKEKLITSDALKQRNEELKTLIYRTSHDLKGPLASMLGLFNLMEKESLDLPTMQLYFSHLKSSAVKLNKTLSSLLEIGITDQVSISKNTFNVYEVVQSVICSLDNYPGREEVKIKTFIDKKIQITTYEGLIRSTVQNLVENSIKYRRLAHEVAATIQISVRVQKDKMVLIVKDNGQGMSQEVLKRAFEMFYRGNECSEGSGLGLFIVKNNVEKAGGQIRIKSKEQEGSEIKIVLFNVN